MSLAMITNP